MKNLTLVLAIAGAAVLLAACQQKPAVQPTAVEPAATFAAAASSDVSVFATLCFGDPATSFDCESSKLASHLAEALHTADTARVAHRISAAEGQQIANEVRTSEALVDKALDVCRITNKTGECTRDSKLAHELLTQAQAAAAALP